jgi:hypothetical protein
MNARRKGAAKKKISGISGVLLGGVDEVFHPTRYEVQLERDRQTILPAPAPLAGDGDKGVYGGKVSIDLTESRGAEESGN